MYPSEGSAIQLVKFRMVVFRPFIGEIITGKLVGSNREGLKISVDFFDDILIPASLLQSPCVYNPSDGLWTWKYGENHDTDFVMDLGEEVKTSTFIVFIRCRVVVSCFAIFVATLGSIQSKDDDIHCAEQLSQGDHGHHHF